MRLNKFLADAGIASRRKADDLIISGKIKINGKIVRALGLKLDTNKDRVYYNGIRVHLITKFDYVVLNKPGNCITTTSDTDGRLTVLDLVKTKQRIYPVGRLDRDTTGVLLLTNDGEFAYRVAHPKYNVRKVYQAGIDKPIKGKDIDRLQKGVLLEDGLTAPAKVLKLDNRRIQITIHEGRNHQIKRMFEKLNYTVTDLERTSVAGLSIKGLQPGDWRYLSKSEIFKFRQQLKLIGNKDN